MSGWGKGSVAKPRGRRKGQGGHWQVLVDGVWIGERIVERWEAVQKHGSAQAAAKALGILPGDVSEAVRKYEAAVIEKATPTGKLVAVAVEIPPKASKGSPPHAGRTPPDRRAEEAPAAAPAPEGPRDSAGSAPDEGSQAVPSSTLPPSQAGSRADRPAPDPIDDPR